MLVMYLCVGVINAGLVFVCEGIDVGHVFVLGVSMLVMHLCVRVIYVGHVFVC